MDKQLTTVTGTATEVITAYTAVAIFNDSVTIVDGTVDDASIVSKGIALNSAQIGQSVLIQLLSNVTNPLWTFVEGLVYIGAAGALTQSVTGLASVDPIGSAVSPTELNINAGATGYEAALDNLDQIYQDSSEPTGMVDRTESTISFDDVTRTLIITPVAASFSFWEAGVNYSKSAAETFVISAIEGLHHIYYEEGVLKEVAAFEVSLITKWVWVASIYWDATNNERILFGDERHGMVMDSATHAHLHLSIGTTYISGLALSDFIIDGAGTLDTEAQLSASSGQIRDEDILHLITGESAPATIPVLYRDGAAGNWRKKAPNTFPFIYSGEEGYAGVTVPYNEWTGAIWQLTATPSGNFTLVHIYATNDIDYPIIAIQGQNSYLNRPQARDGANAEIGAITGIPYEEFVPIGTVIIQTNSAYTNTPKAIFVSTDTGDNYVNWLVNQLTAGSPIGDHGHLGGLADDDHPHYYNQSRLNTWLATKTTSDLAEGTNLYYTDARVAAYVTQAYVNSLNVDADTVDTLHASQFLRSDVADSAAGLVTFNAGTSIPDNQSYYSGSSNDLSLSHNGTNSYVSNNQTGTFYITQYVNSGNLSLRAKDSGNTVREGITVGGGITVVNQYYGGSLRAKTSDNGLDLYTSGTGILATTRLFFRDAVGATLGYIGMASSTNSDLYYKASVTGIHKWLNSTGTETLSLSNGGSLTTYAHLFVGANAYFGDGGYAYWGSGNDLGIVHDGTNSTIINYNTGVFVIENRALSGELWLKTDTSGGTSKFGIVIGGITPYVRLYENGAERLRTISYGVTITSADGYVNIGAQNTNWCWYDTDRAGHYFNTKVHVNGEIAVYGTNIYLDANGIWSTKATLTANLNMNGGHITRNAHHTGHLEGSYNNIGANTLKSNPIYTIGSSYNPTDAALSNMYGIGYCRGDATFINSTDLGANPGSAWGLYIAADGNARIFLDAQNGRIYCKDDIYEAGAKLSDKYAPAYSGAIVYHSVSENLGTAIYKILSWNSEGHDVGSWHDITTNNSRFTIPTGVTRVRITANISFNGGSGIGWRIIRIRKNGGNLTPRQETTVYVDTAFNSVMGIPSFVDNCVAGDYYEIDAYQSTASGANRANYSTFSIEAVT